ncbi:MAG: DUF1330 domain-containing protein [Myroides sp.]|jgi:uncharacterized protein (DUF1330 family)|nr:DUF1330 domain-containing protein [Myroides sp.]
MKQTYLTADFEAGKRLFLKQLQGKIVNLNLIRLKEVADYSEHPELQSEEVISSFDAYQKYITLTLPFLEASGGKILYIGTGDQFLIGPQEERWDLCMLIEQNSVADFFAFEQNPEYMKIVGHRTAAVADSRLLPLQNL